MDAADAVVPRPTATWRVSPSRLSSKPIGCHFALRDRGSKPPGRAHQHPSVSGPAQSPAGRACPHERLDEHRHRVVHWVHPVGCHLAQRARGPRRRPAGALGGQEIGFALQAQIAFERPREAGPVTIFHRSRGTHDGERRFCLLARSPQVVRSGASTAGAIGCSSNPSFIRSACRRASGKSSVANVPPCGRVQAQGGDLKTVGPGIETKAIGERQSRSPEGRQVRGLGAGAGVGRLVHGERDDKLFHASFGRAGLTAHDCRSLVSDRRR
jgi:hypothetical protein